MTLPVRRLMVARASRSRGVSSPGGGGGGGGGGTWTQTERSASASWNCRDGASLIHLPSGAYAGRLVIIGGWYTGAGPDATPVAAWNSQITTNEVIVSDDTGATWTTSLAHDDSPPTSGAGARFSRGHTVPTVVHNVGGTDYIFRVGGDLYVRGGGHVWRAPVSLGGVDGWERVTTTGPTQQLMGEGDNEATVLHSVCSFNGYLYCVAGQIELNIDATAHARVFRSADGITWTRLADAPFVGRGDHAMCVHNGSLVVIAGEQYNAHARRNDVWRMSTAEAWTEVLANGHGQFYARAYPWAASAGGRLWMGGGANGSASVSEKGDAPYGDSENLRSIFYSEDDGASWARWDNASWNGSHADGVTTTAAGVIYRATGNRFDHATYTISQV